MIDRREMLKLGAMFGAGTALAGCAATRLAPPPASALDWSTYSPEAAGMTRSGAEAIRAAIATHIEENSLTGAVTAVARHGKLGWYEAQGLHDVPAKTPLRKDDIFRLASSSKPVTAVSILILQDAGKLSIDDKVSRFLPSFGNPKVAFLPPELEMERFNFAKREALKSQVKIIPADRELTLKDLLTHTGGLGSVLGMGGPSPAISREKTLADRIPLLGESVLDFQPGTHWSYSPLDAFDVLAHIVEIVSDMPIDMFMRTRIFEPLDMVDTTFHLTPEQQPRLVPLYDREGGNWKIKPDLLGAGDPAMKYLCGAGGLVGTARDYMQFQAMLLNRGVLGGKRVLSNAAVAQMSTNHVGSLFEKMPLMGRKGWGFGLGVGVVVDPVAAGSSRKAGAFGWDGAHGTDGWVDPQQGLAAVYFVQQSTKPPLHAFEKAIAAAIAA